MVLFGTRKPAKQTYSFKPEGWENRSSRAPQPSRTQPRVQNTQTFQVAKVSLTFLKDWILKLFKIVLIVALPLALLYGVYTKVYAWWYTPTVPTQKEAVLQKRKVLDALGAHIMLPDEEPEIYTIDEPEKARKENAVFFKHAEKGDKFIAYRVEGKAFLYNPTKDFIVNVGVLNDTVPSQAPPPTPLPPEQATPSTTPTATPPTTSNTQKSPPKKIKN